MPSTKTLVGLAAAAVLVVGGGYIVYAGRPVMKQNTQATPTIVQERDDADDQKEDESENESGAVVATTSTPVTEAKGVYTMSDVEKHSTKEDCWSAIGGDVYDLTSWVSRHPGGEKPILFLCGKDGTDGYTKKHGGAERPKAMLVLLKIGTLKP